MSNPDPPPLMVAPFHLGVLEQTAAAEAAAGSATAAATAPGQVMGAVDPPTEPVPVPRAQHARPPRRRRRVAIALFAAVILAAAAVALVRLRSPAPDAVVTSAVPATFHVASGPVVLPWATIGQSAIAVPALGIDVTSGPETAVPVASLTKMMTAYVILHDHPVHAGQNGPDIVMTQADVDDFENDTVQDEASVQVDVGEVLTERQLLEGLLVHSANNFADTLARWDAGSIPTFVAEMNSTAAQIGMDHTHFVDPSGFDEGSQSTADDLLKVAALDMGDPTFVRIVRMSSVTLPIAGTVSTYTPLLGFQGVIGVKSGFTTAAGGCDVVAVERTVHGRSTLVLAAVTGQEGPNVLVDAGFIALNLANHASSSIALTPVVASGEDVASVSAAGHRVAAVAVAPAAVLSWPGVTGHRALVDGPAIVAGARRGQRIGSVMVMLGTQREEVPVVLRGDLPKPTLLQRLF